MVQSYSFKQFSEELALLQQKLPELELKHESQASNPFLLKEYCLWASFERDFGEESEKVLEGVRIEFDILFDTTNSLPGLMFRAFREGQEVKEVEGVLKCQKARVDLKAHPVRQFHPQVFYLHECQVNEIIEGMDNRLEGWFSTVFPQVFGLYLTL